MLDAVPDLGIVATNPPNLLQDDGALPAAKNAKLKLILHPFVDQKISVFVKNRATNKSNQREKKDKLIKLRSCTYSLGQRGFSVSDRAQKTDIR